MVLVYILYLNLLVAMLNHSYTDLAAEAESEALLSRTEALLRYVISSVPSFALERIRLDVW